MSNGISIQNIGYFYENSQNGGTVNTAVFAGSAENFGSITNVATFTDTAVNTGSVSGVVIFSGEAVNNGIVKEALFIGNSQNVGTITLNATFAENASNLATGVVQGSAVFTDNTINTGTVAGNAEIAATADNSGGTVQGSIGAYVQADGAFSYGYYVGGVKTAPPDYQTVVRNILGVWYMYDSFGNSALATGIYSDGISNFQFINGIKGSSFPSYTQFVNLNGTTYYYSTANVIQDGTVLYSNPELTSLVLTLDPVSYNSYKLATSNAGSIILSKYVVLSGVEYYYRVADTISDSVMLYTNVRRTDWAYLNVVPYQGFKLSTNYGSIVLTKELILDSTPYYYSANNTITNAQYLYVDGLNQTPAANLTATALDEFKIITNDNGEIYLVKFVTLNGSPYYLYKNSSIQINTLLYQDIWLQNLALNLIVDPYGDQILFTNSEGAINLINIPNTITLNGTSYYYASGGTLQNGIVLYANKILTSVAANLNNLVYAPTNQLVSTTQGGAVSLANNYNTITILDTNVYYYNLNANFQNGTVLYSNTLLTVPAINVNIVNYNGQDATLTTNSNGVITIILPQPTTPSVLLDATSYYYEANPLQENTILYTDQELTIVAANLSNKVFGDQLLSTDNDGKVSLTNNYNLIILGSSTYYYGLNDVLQTGTTLYTNTTLSSPAANLSEIPYNGILLYTDNSGVVLISSSKRIVLSGTTYYFYLSDTIQDGTILYTDDERTVVAEYLTNLPYNSKLLSTDSNGAITLTNAIVLDGSIYYYGPTDIIQNGTILYIDAEFSSVAMSLSNLAYGNNQLLSTDEFGSISLTDNYNIVSLGSPSSSYYYSLNDNLQSGIYLYQDFSLTTVAANLSGLSYNGNILSTTNTGLVVIAVSVNLGLTYYFDANYSSLQDGAVLYTDLKLTTPAANLSKTHEAYPTVVPQYNILTTDGNGVVTFVLTYNEVATDQGTFYIGNQYYVMNGVTLYTNPGLTTKSVLLSGAVLNDAPDQLISTNSNGIITVTDNYNIVGSYYYRLNDSIANNVILYADTLLTTPASYITIDPYDSDKVLATGSGGEISVSKKYIPNISTTYYYDAQINLINGQLTDGIVLFDSPDFTAGSVSYFSKFLADGGQCIEQMAGYNGVTTSLTADNYFVTDGTNPINVGSPGVPTYVYYDGNVDYNVIVYSDPCKATILSISDGVSIGSTFNGQINGLFESDVNGAVITLNNGISIGQDNFYYSWSNNLGGGAPQVGTSLYTVPWLDYAYVASAGTYYTGYTNSGEVDNYVIDSNGAIAEINYIQ